jgi:hypothetical protein
MLSTLFDAYGLSDALLAPAYTSIVFCVLGWPPFQ